MPDLACQSSSPTRQARGGRARIKPNREHALLPFQIDHVISEKHGGATVAENLALIRKVLWEQEASDDG